MTPLTKMERRRANFPDSGRIRPSSRRNWRDNRGHAKPRNKQRRRFRDKHGNWREMYGRWARADAAVRRAHHAAAAARRDTA